MPALLQPPAGAQSRPTAAAPSDLERKALATLRAELALAGHTLHEGADGALIVGRWGMTREFRDLAELRAWCVHLGIGGVLDELDRIAAGGTA